MSKTSADIGAVVVGTSFGVLTHVRALRRAGIAVVGLVGRDEAKTKDRADRVGIPHALTDLSAALALPDVHVVTVTTPPHTHAPITLAAVAAGKHVLCEKPFALDVAEARAMRDAAERAGVIHLLGTEFRFRTSDTTLRRIVRSGAIGEPRVALFMLDLPSLVDATVELPEWWESAADGGGWLGAAGSHAIDQVRSTLGEFVGLSASLNRISPRPAMTADDTYTVHFQLVDGCAGVLHSSCAVGGPMLPTTKIAGTRGCAWVQRNQELRRDEVWVDSGSGPRRMPDPEDVPSTPPEPPPPEFLPRYSIQTRWHTTGADLAPYTRLYERLRDLVRGDPVEDDPPAATFVDGVADQAVLDAVRRSAAGEGWVALGRT